MNSNAAARCKDVESEIAAKGGLEGYRSHVIKHLALKTVVKESHCTSIHRICYNQTDPDYNNLFATVGGNQATIYDDLNMGDYISVVVHFTNSETPYHKGGAVAGADPCIQIVSVAEARVVALLKGHTSEVVAMSTAVQMPGLLMSLSKDGVVQLWDIPNQLRIACISTDAFTAELHPSGLYIVSGEKSGRLGLWPLQLDHQSTVSPCVRPFGRVQHVLTLTQQPQREALSLPGPLNDTVDCILFLPELGYMARLGCNPVAGDRLAAKSTDGRITIWNLTNRLQLTTFRVPGGSSATGSHKGRCTFSHTTDGAYICVGNSSGDVFVLNSHTGQRVGHVSAVKVNSPVCSCALSDDCRHLLAAVGHGYIFRYEYIKQHEDMQEEQQQQQERQQREQQEQQRHQQQQQATASAGHLSTGNSCQGCDLPPAVEEAEGHVNTLPSGMVTGQQ